MMICNVTKIDLDQFDLDQFICFLAVRGLNGLFHVSFTREATACPSKTNAARPSISSSVTSRTLLANAGATEPASKHSTKTARRAPRSWILIALHRRGAHGRGPLAVSKCSPVCGTPIKPYDRYRETGRNTHPNGGSVPERQYIERT